MKKNATIDEVAALAGVSRAQTARALRDDPCVRPETRERVRAAATQLAYRTNVAARALSEAHSRSVGLLIGEPFNPSHMMLGQAIDAALAAIGLDAIVSLRSVTDPATATEVDWLASFRARGLIRSIRRAIRLRCARRRRTCRASTSAAWWTIPASPWSTPTTRKASAWPWIT